MKKSQLVLARPPRQGFVSKVGVALTAGLLGASAFAVDHSAAITAAGGDATTSVTTAVTTVIGIVAIMVGVGLIIRALMKA